MRGKLRAVAAILYAAALIVLLSANHILAQMIPETTEFRLNTEKGTGIPMEKLQKILPEDGSFYSEKDAYIPESSLKIKKVMTSGMDTTTAPSLKLLSGSLIKRETDETEHVAVVSRTLALEQFLTVNAVGKKLSLDGVQYTVVGIYEDVLPEIVKDGYDRVYVPFNNCSDWRQTTADVISITGSTVSLQVSMGKYYDVYEKEDYFVIKQTAGHWVQIMNLVLGIFVSVLLYKKIFAIEKIYIKRFLKAYEKEYFLQCIVHNKKLIIKMALFLLLFAGYIFVLWKIMKFEVVIPAEIVPDDNIFALSWYWKCIVEDIQLHNRGVLLGNDYVNRLATVINLSGFLMWCTAGSFICFIFKTKRKSDGVRKSM